MRSKLSLARNTTVPARVKLVHDGKESSFFHARLRKGDEGEREPKLFRELSACERRDSSNSKLNLGKL